MQCTMIWMPGTVMFRSFLTSQSKRYAVIQSPLGSLAPLKQAEEA